MIDQNVFVVNTIKCRKSVILKRSYHIKVLVILTGSFKSQIEMWLTLTYLENKYKYPKSRGIHCPNVESGFYIYTMPACQANVLTTTLLHAPNTACVYFLNTVQNMQKWKILWLTKIVKNSTPSSYSFYIMNIMLITITKWRTLH